MHRRPPGKWRARRKKGGHLVARRPPGKGRAEKEQQAVYAAVRPISEDLIDPATPAQQGLQEPRRPSLAAAPRVVLSRVLSRPPGRKDRNPPGRDRHGALRNWSAMAEQPF